MSTVEHKDEESRLIAELAPLQPYEKLERIAADMRWAERCANQAIPCSAARVRVWVGTLEAMARGLAAPLANRRGRRAAMAEQRRKG